MYDADMRLRFCLRSVSWMLLIAVAALTLAVVACTVGGSSEDALRAQLEKMLLAPEDVPEGYSLASTEFSDNEDLSSRADDREGELAKLIGLGRLLGVNVVYEPEGPEVPVILGINSAVSLYETADGASQSFAEAVRVAEEADWESSHPGFENLTVETIERPDLADEVLWLRVRGSVGDKVATDDFLLVRVGTARGQVRVAAVSEDEAVSEALIDQIEALATKQVERMRAAQ